MLPSCIRHRSTQLPHQDTYTTNIRQCRANNFQTGKQLLTNHLEGFCKYGDRCTFAHGDVDLRAKFVPASNMYPGGTQSVSGEASQIPAQSNGGIDYSAFSQPPDAVPTMKPQDYGFDTQFNYAYGGESAFYQVPSSSQDLQRPTGK